jgi:hypothetical protein
MRVITENTAFVYIWYNKVKRMFYIGKHYGSVNDGYVCSSKMMLIDYNRNPDHFKRRILGYVNEIDGNQSLQAELKWLSLIPDEQLGKKYYNLKNKNFGNTRGHKKSYVWNAGMSKEQEKEYREMRKNKLFCLLTEKPKKGMIFKPIIKYNCDFCEKAFESKRDRRFCSPSCSAKWGNANGNSEKLKITMKGRIGSTRGLKNPYGAENGKKSAAKQAATVTGRRMLVKEDGTRTWIYPNKNIGTNSPIATK